MKRFSWRSLLGAATVAALAGSLTAETALAESMTAAQSGARTIPRNQTLILARTPTTTIADFNQMNPYGLGGLGRIRDTLNKTIYESLFYYNHNTGDVTAISLHVYGADLGTHPESVRRVYDLPVR